MLFWTRSLTESPYKVVVEQLVGLGSTEGTAVEEEEEERLLVLQRPLEICLKHSTVSRCDASECPLVLPQPGVAALHEYAEWITELNHKQGHRDGERRPGYGMSSASLLSLLLL